MQALRKVGLEQGTVTLEEFQWIDQQVVEAIKPRLIGRRIFDRTNLPDAGYMQAKWYEQTGMSAATISMYGESESEDKVHNTPSTLPIPIISKDYWLHWREILAGRHVGESLDAQNAREAARKVAEDEDKLLLTGEYTGFPAMGIEGLATATGRSTQGSSGAWPANAITDINGARAQLKASGFVDVDIAMIAPPALAQKLDAQIGTTAFTYREFLLQNNLVQAIYESASLFAADGGADSALLVVPDRDNFDVVVAQDVENFLWQGKRMNYFGRVYEALVPRIKRPEAIVELTTVT